MSSLKTTRRHFTEAARAAAVVARRRKYETAVPRETPAVYVVRLAGANLQFGWEIRRFGALVLDKSSAEYPTTQDALSAGEAVLNGWAIGT